MKIAIALLATLMLGCFGHAARSCRPTPPLAAAASMAQQAQAPAAQAGPQLPSFVEVLAREAAPGDGGLSVIDLVTELSPKAAFKVIFQLGAARAQGAKRVLLVINSPGGAVDFMYDVARQIERSQVPVWCVVDGEANSASAALFQACRHRLMTKRSALMIHEPQITVEKFTGGPNEWQATADNLRESTKALVEMYGRRLNVPLAQVAARIAGGRQWWLAWQDALKVGAADCVLPGYEEALEMVRSGRSCQESGGRTH